MWQPQQVQIVGPAKGAPLTTYDFLATVTALDVPVTYTWEATGQTPVIHTGQDLTDTVQFTWDVTGTQTITVTASNGFTTVVDTQLMVITTTVPTDYYVYLPLVAKAMSAPPSDPDIRITHIEHTPTGDAVQGEYVRIENFADAAQEMTGWTLRDEANRTFTFPVFTLPVSGVVQVWTGSGTNTATDLYWGSGTAIWNNTGDTAYLRDAAGEGVDTYTY